MYSIKKILMAITLLLSAAAVTAQMKNSKTNSVKIYGNCGMCETKIEKAGNIKNVASVDWNKDTKMATLTYDSSKTSEDEILKRIALAGYDSEKFLAPDSVYDELHGCCQYDREAKTTTVADAKVAASTMDHHANHSASSKEVAVENDQLKVVFDNYFSLKDALVKTEGPTASAKSKELLMSLNTVEMDKLAMDVHMVWMKVMKDLKADAKSIADTQDIKKQRALFVSLSKNIYDLIKLAKYETAVYYQFCPMANGGKGANWLSKENAVKNPYYGSQMMTCGKTVETIVK